jgi:hypothetical protein
MIAYRNQAISWVCAYISGMYLRGQRPTLTVRRHLARGAQSGSETLAVGKGTGKAAAGARAIAR